MTVHQFEDNAAKGAQGYAINWDTAEARVKRPQGLSHERPSGYGPRAAAVPERGV